MKQRSRQRQRKRKRQTEKEDREGDREGKREVKAEEGKKRDRDGDREGKGEEGGEVEDDGGRAGSGITERDVEREGRRIHLGIDQLCHPLHAVWGASRELEPDPVDAALLYGGLDREAGHVHQFRPAPMSQLRPGSASQVAKHLTSQAIEEPGRESCHGVKFVEVDTTESDAMREMPSTHHQRPRLQTGQPFLQHTG